MYCNPLQVMTISGVHVTQDTSVIVSFIHHFVIHMCTHLDKIHGL